MKERIAEISQAVGKSLNQMALEIGFTKGYLSRIINGERVVNERLISLLCTTYNVSETWLRTGEGEMFTSPQEEDDEVYRRVLKQKVRSLPPEAQKMILDFCQEIQNALPPDINAPAPPAKKNGGP